jgi:dihydroorotase
MGEMIGAGYLSVEGDYVRPDGKVARGKITITKGMITDISQASGSADVVCREGDIIFPGFIDIHVHAREYALPEDATGEQVAAHDRQLRKECYATMCAAAVNGGVVAFADMPNNPVPPCDSSSYLAKRFLAAGSCTIDHVVYALIRPGSMPFSSRSIPYKVYTHDFAERQLYSTLRLYRGQFVAAHCENKEIVERDGSRPAEAEVRDISVMLDIATKHGLSLHISHVSTEKGLERILEAKRGGVDVTCETTPTYLFFSKDNIRGAAKGGWLTMKPPIRSESDRQAMLDGLKLGYIDVLATDHAPHTAADKDAGVFGIPLDDHYTSFVGWLLQEGIPMKRIVEVCCIDPGRFMERFTGLCFGKIAQGYVGSLTVVEKLPPASFGSSRNPVRVLTKCGWSPFEGVKLGREYLLDAKETIVRGVRMKSGRADEK